MTEVVLLTKDDCDLCEHAKATLGRLGEEFELHVREVSLDSGEGAGLARDANAPFPPVVLQNEARPSFSSRRRNSFAASTTFAKSTSGAGSRSNTRRPGVFGSSATEFQGWNSSDEIWPRATRALALLTSM